MSYDLEEENDLWIEHFRPKGEEKMNMEQLKGQGKVWDEVNAAIRGDKVIEAKPRIIWPGEMNLGSPARDGLVRDLFKMYKEKLLALNPWMSEFL